ncbi:MAG: BamA/TamA family outer membrane protein [Alistipes sp.]|nr:BamA/TamA family outer membrane protein [Alistipes sp.]
MRRLVRYMLLVAVLLVGAACNVTRSLPEGSYLLSRVVVEGDEDTPREERITDERDDLLKHVRQTPNKRFLGLDFYVWIYEHANPEKSNWWNNFKRKIGEEPVLLNMDLTQRSIENLETYMRTKGYFSSSVTCDVDTTRRKRRAELTYRLTQREAMRIESLDYNFRDTSLRSVILADTANRLIRHGDVLDITLLDEERNRIASYLNNRGYFDFTVNNITYEVDTIGMRDKAKVSMVISPVLLDYDERGRPKYEDHSIYRINKINVYPTYDPMLRSTAGFKEGAVIDTVSYGGLSIIRDVEASPRLRDVVLRRIVPMQPNSIYSSREVQATYNELMSLGLFRSTKVSFSRSPMQDSEVTYIGNQADGVDQFVDIQERYLDCNIYCTPALKQSMKVEVEASSTSSFYGLSATLGYTNNNVFRGAEAFDIAARFGFEFMYARDVAKRSAQELNVTAGLSFPRFLTPFHISYGDRVTQPRTRLELAFDFQNRPYYRRNISTARWAYSWRRGERSSFVVRPLDINWIDVKSVDQKFLEDIDNQYLRTSFESQLNAGLTASYVYNTQRNNLDRTSTLLRANLETSGNVLQGIEALFSEHAEGKDYYEIFGIRYSQYLRADVNLSHTEDLGHRMALAGRLFAGVGYTYGNSKGRSIPFDRMFYCGGANSMRGWVPRTLGPGGVAGVNNTLYPAQVGDMRLEANLEFRFPVWSIFYGALFFDAGNVWYLRQSEAASSEEVFRLNDFYKQLGFNTGLGLRIDATFVILRIDLGLQLHNPGNPVGQRWIHDFKWKNMALNFGVGYPF